MYMHIFANELCIYIVSKHVKKMVLLLLPTPHKPSKLLSFKIMLTITTAKLEVSGFEYDQFTTAIASTQVNTDISNE